MDGETGLLVAPGTWTRWPPRSRLAPIRARAAMGARDATRLASGSPGAPRRPHARALRGAAAGARGDPARGRRRGHRGPAAASLLVIVTGRPSRCLRRSSRSSRRGARRRLAVARRPRRGAVPSSLLLLLPTLVQFHAARRAHQRRRRQLLRLRPLAGEGRRPRLHQRVHALRPASSARTSRVPTRTGLRRSIFAVGPGAGVDPVLRRRRGRRPARRRCFGARRRPLRLRPVPRERGRAGQPALGFAAVLLVHDVAAPALRRRASPCSPPPRVWLATFLLLVHGPAADDVPRAVGVRRRARGVAVGPRSARAGRPRGFLAPRPRARPRHVPALAERGCSRCCPAFDLAAARRGAARRRAARRRGRPRSPARSSGALPADGGLEGPLRRVAAALPAARRGLPAPRPSLRAGDAVLVAPRPALVDAGALAGLPRASVPLLRARRALALPLLLPAGRS